MNASAAHDVLQGEHRCMAALTACGGTGAAGGAAPAAVDGGHQCRGHQHGSLRADIHRPYAGSKVCARHKAAPLERTSVKLALDTIRTYADRALKANPSFQASAVQALLPKACKAVPMVRPAQMAAAPQ